MPKKEGSEFASNDGIYRGLINCINEDGRNELRKYIQSIFFKEKIEKREKEIEDMEELKKKYLEKKEEDKNSD